MDCLKEVLRVRPRAPRSAPNNSSGPGSPRPDGRPPTLASTSTNASARGSSLSRSTNGATKLVAASSPNKTAHWKRAPLRSLRWLIPITLRPPHSTSPAARLTKQTSRPVSPVVWAPRWTSDSTPTTAKASTQAAPSHDEDRLTSSSQSGSPRGMSRSTHITPSGRSKTAPPPERRRTTSRPIAEALDTRPGRSRWPLPSTTVVLSSWC